MGPEAKQVFLKAISQGVLRFEAARRANTTVANVKRHLKADPEFAAAFDDAQLEASEPVENVLYDAAKRGEPWAVTKWLAARDKERWAEPTKSVEVKHSGTVQLEPGQTALSAVGALIEALKERQAIRTGEDSTFASIRAPRPVIETTSREIERAAPPPPEELPEPATLPEPPSATQSGMFTAPVTMPRPGANRA
jgi:hypothetical protein